jgi:hypothetical protein
VDSSRRATKHVAWSAARHSNRLDLKAGDKLMPLVRAYLEWQGNKILNPADFTAPLELDRVSRE